MDADRLLALFPALYSRREPANDPVIDRRDWVALRSPGLRLMGPNWSFGAILAKQDCGGHDLVTLDESERPQFINEENRLHRPVHMRARIAGARGGGDTPYGGNFSRYSVAAVDLLTQDDADPLQLFAEADGPSDPIDPLTSSLILSSFGRLPHNGNPEALFLPACRLLAGEVWTVPDAGWCDAARERLGLATPDDADPGRHRLVLLPDGLALRGRMALPWAPGAALAGWFKLTPRRAGLEGGGDLQLWMEGMRADRQAARTGVELAEWGARIDDLRAIVRAAPRHALPPRWFDMETTATIGPDALRWPCRSALEILLHRRADDPIQVVGEALRVRLGTDDDGRRGRLSIRPGDFTIAPHGMRGVKISSGGEGPLMGRDPMRSDAAYAFDTAPEDGPTGEWLELGRAPSAMPPPEASGTAPAASRVLDLALPQIANATRLRAAMGFDDPPATPTADDENLWLFTPLRSGWLHWAFPNMTVARADAALKGTPAADERGPDPSETFATAGLWSLRPGSSDRERAWAMTFANAASARLEATIRLSGSTWHLEAARVWMADLSVTMDCIVPATTFAQTKARLLPERSDRALRADGLDARTANLLTGEEARLWAGGVRVGARIEGLRLQPPHGENSTGAVFASDGAGSLLSLDFARPPARGSTPAPWLWSRHERLPSFQTMPLATAGAADRQPSSLRELAPLVLGEGADARLRFEWTFDMTAPGPELVRDWPALHPMAAFPYEVEIGQAITTLPSLTLAPGLGEAGPPSGAWAGTPAPVGRVLRHDVALADEFYTLAKLPPPAAAETADEAVASEGDRPVDEDGERPAGEPRVEPPAGFRPLPYNAPGTGATSAWHPIWSGHLRALALSATTARDMVSEGDLRDVFFGSQWPAAVTFDAQVRLGQPDGEAQEYEPALARFSLRSAGRLTIKPDGAEEIVLDGLPATSDLTGLDLSDETFVVTRGALSRYAVEIDGQGIPGDQAGWAFGPAAVGDGGMLWRSVVRRLPSFGTRPASPETEYRQVGLTAPLTLSAATPEVALHFRDVLVETPPDAPDDKDLLTFQAAEAIDCSQPDKALHHGFAWSLTHPQPGDASVPAGHVRLRWVLFEPLGLEQVAVARADSALLEVVIRGRVALPSGQGAAVPGGGEAMLTIGGDGAWTLRATALSLPLADPDGRPGGPPVLTAGALTLGSDGQVAASGARLDFVIGGPDTSGALLSDALTTAMIDGDALRIASERTFVRLPTLGAGEPPSVAAAHSLSLTTEDGAALLVLSQTHDLMTRETIKNQDFLRLVAGPPDRDVMDIDILANLTFADGTLGIEWALAGRSEVRLLGFAPTAGRGAGLGRYEVRADGSLKARLLEHRFWLELGSTLRLDHDTTLPEQPQRLTGTLEGSNLFSWPHLSAAGVGAFGDVAGAVEAVAAGRLSHEATLHVDLARVGLAEIVSGKLRLPVRATHRLTADNGAALEWTDFQSVTLWSSEALAAELRARAADEAVGQTFSLALPVADADGLRPGLVGTRNAGHWALTPEGMRDLACSLLGASRPIVDLSAHHFLASGPAGSGRLHALPVPGFLDPQGGGAWRQYALPSGRTVRRAGDRALAAGVPGLDDATGARLRARLQAGRREARRRRTGLADALEPTIPREALRPLFQGFAVVHDETGERPEHRFWAETALWLSAALAAFADAPPRAAHTLTANGWIADAFFDPRSGLVRPAPPGSPRTVTTAPAHAASWGRSILTHISEAFTPVPPDADDRPGGTQYQVIALDTSHSLPGVVARHLVEADSASDLGEAIRADAMAWAADMLSRVAPHAPLALLVRVPQSRLGPGQADASALVTARQPRLGRRVRTSNLSDGARAAQSQRSLHPQGPAPAGLAVGFEAAGTTPATFADCAGRLPEAGGTDLALTASGAAFTSALPGGEPPSAAEAIWLTSRETTPFRPHAEMGQDRGGRLAPALPAGTDIATPAALLSARASDARLPRPPAAGQCIVPPVISEGKVAPRSGVWMGHRLGLTSADAAARWSASERPVWMRTPRPVELGVNDRTVASAFEPRPVALGPDPEAVLFGPAASRSALSGGAAGLGRTPRAAHATRVRLAAPDGGLIEDDWSGTVELHAETISEPAPTDPWRVLRADLTLGDTVFDWAPEGDQVLGKTLSISGFRPPTGRDDVGAASAHARALPSGTACALWLTCTGSNGLTRRIGFRLWRASGRLVERPVHLRFEDPAYNDRLSGLPKLARRDVPTGTDEMLLLAEAGTVRPGAHVEVGLALASRVAGLAPDASFEQDGATLHLRANGARRAVSLGFEVRRSRAEASIEVEFKKLIIEASGAFASVPLTLSKLRELDGGAPFRLEDGDQLRIAVGFAVANPEGGTDLHEAFGLALDIADRPLLPPNPAIYHLLGLTLPGDGAAAGDGPRLVAPLQVTSPDPWIVELVDPKEMASGIVRRRAIYRWSTFLSAEERAARFTIQKTAATGASWIGADLDRDWTSFQSPLGEAGAGRDARSRR